MVLLHRFSLYKTLIAGINGGPSYAPLYDRGGGAESIYADHHIPITASTLSRVDVDAFAALRDEPTPIIAHCSSGTRSALLWALTRLREVQIFAPKTEATHAIDIASLSAVATRLR